MVTPISAENEPVSEAAPKGVPLVDTVAYEDTRDVDNPPCTMGEDLVEAPQLDLTCLIR